MGPAGAPQNEPAATRTTNASQTAAVNVHDVMRRAWRIVIMVAFRWGSREMTTVLYVAMIAIGVFGLVMTGAYPTQHLSDTQTSLLETYRRQFGSQQELIDALEHKAAAFENLNEALERKAAAAENLAAEREKALILYRGLRIGDGLVPPAPIQMFGIPAEKLGGDKGN
jgi:hypothetical protein